MHAAGCRLVWWRVRDKAATAGDWSAPLNSKTSQKKISRELQHRPNNHLYANNKAPKSPLTTYTSTEINEILIRIPSAQCPAKTPVPWTTKPAKRGYPRLAPPKPPRRKHNHSPQHAPSTTAQRRSRSHGHNPCRHSSGHRQAPPTSPPVAPARRRILASKPIASSQPFPAQRAAPLTAAPSSTVRLRTRRTTKSSRARTPRATGCTRRRRCSLTP